MTRPTEKEQIRLLMNGDQAKSIVDWLLEDQLFEFPFLFWTISIWKCWFPIVITPRGRGLK
jgi:hypothetical protein